ncbi:MAG: hypothetical protein KGS72_26515, partial [Cyanobacteria bacterium REEB67]|nr:hypothetical protein [Cyanobacteria bacterium REEB67]
MSGVFMDGGNHDAISHGGDGIDHGGHDHGHHGVQHGHGQGGHSFLAQILGLDQQDHAHLAHHGGEGASGHAPSQTPAWSSALQALKIENLIAGINITPNFLLVLLFAAFTGWLGVIYWIRHHEPFANQVLGSSAAYAPTAGADRRLINNARDALPFKTSAQSGMVYCPQPQPATAVVQPGSPTNPNLTAAMSSLFGQNAAVKAYPAAGASTAAPQTFNSAVSSSSPVNQNLSAAMSAALGGPAAAAPGQMQTVPAAPVSGGFAAAPGSMARSAPFMAGGNARLFSARPGQANPSYNAGGLTTGFAAAPAGAMGAGMGGGMRLFSSRRSMMA